jgi:hypothetical protein
MTNEVTAADKMKAACDAIMQGDFMTAMSELTADAMSEAMQLAGGFSAAPMPETYKIDSEDMDGEAHKFHVTFKGSGQELGAAVWWGLVGDRWMITKISLDGV